jgi:hypothetical protein
VKLRQTYESTVEDEDGRAVHFLAVPHRSFDETHSSRLAQDGRGLLEEMGFSVLKRISPTEIPNAIAQMVSADTSEDANALRTELALDRITDPTAASRDDEELRAFAEYVAFANLVPFEESPINLVSLAGKAASTAKSPEALGAFIGVLAGGATPMLLVTVPTGIIVCAAASAFAKFLFENRQSVFGKLFGVNPKRRSRRRPPAKQAS